MNLQLLDYLKNKSNTVLTGVRILLIVVTVLIAVVPVSKTSADLAPSKDEIRAAYLYNLLNFFTWPERSNIIKNSPYSLCFIGVGASKPTFAKIAELTANSRPIETHFLIDIKKSKDCHIVYIGPKAYRKVNRILEVIDDRVVITVSSSMSFTRRGGMVGLVSSRARVNLVINLAAALRAGFTISANLLEAARIENIN